VKAPVLAVVSTVTEDYRAALVNVSGTGASLSAPRLPANDEEVIFRAEKVQAFGKVVWSQEGQCGIAFEGPIDLAEVDRLRSQTDIWSLTSMSPEERGAAEDWNAGSVH
jgi:hypothetical protein